MSDELDRQSAAGFYVGDDAEAAGPGHPEISGLTCGRTACHSIARTAVAQTAAQLRQNLLSEARAYWSVSPPSADVSSLVQAVVLQVLVKVGD